MPGGSEIWRESQHIKSKLPLSRRAPAATKSFFSFQSLVLLRAKKVHLAELIPLLRHRGSSCSNKQNPIPQRWKAHAKEREKERERETTNEHFQMQLLLLFSFPSRLSHLLRGKKNELQKNRPSLAARASSSSNNKNKDDEFARHSHPLSADDLGDWRAFRAALVTSERGAGPPPTVGALSEPARAAARWAHSVSAPEKGCLLLAARPDLGPLFTQAVVLIVDHGKEFFF